jgi:hypothetical protein
MCPSNYASGGAHRFKEHTNLATDRNRFAYPREPPGSNSTQGRALSGTGLKLQVTYYLCHSELDSDSRATTVNHSTRRGFRPSLGSISYQAESESSSE